MFPVFPVLFPVCSQFSGNRFIVFPAFSVYAARAMSAISCIPFLFTGNTGNCGNGIEKGGLAFRKPWNRRGTTGNK